MLMLVPPTRILQQTRGVRGGGEEGYRLIELKVIFIMINVVPRTDRAEKIQVRGSIMRVVKIDNVEVDYLKL